MEEGWYDDPITEQIAERYLRPLLDAGIDTLVLGCTHYPLLVPVLRRVAGPDVTLVDSAEAVAEVVAAGLTEGGIESASPPSGRPEHHVCVTDAGEKFHQLAGRILGEDVTLEWVEVT